MTKMICTHRTILLYRGQDLKTLKTEELYHIILKQEQKINKFKSLMKEYGEDELERSYDVCPECNYLLVTKWSGVECSNCGYQNCF